MTDSVIQKYTLVKLPTKLKQIKVNNSIDAVDFLRKIWNSEFKIVESFYVLFIDRKNTILGYRMFSTGHTSASLVDIKLICNFAINCLANGIIIAHNHPGGQLSFGADDINTHEKLKKSLELFQISLLDSLILTEDNHIGYE